ncbi:Protein cwh43 [Elasticomyces elasticus]|nr:Protein cwh43 [Elasticomyces elasticus]KAK3662694.1 Protein cwh43 [Elasticomyces elasticus]KAK4923406.1 Protein cwh43 [Elasticomyces elasticus]KAK5753311.1 Protein cwh43 [Elasticomyces elasticus]
MAPSDIARIPGHYISNTHTLFAYAAFVGALITGLSLHYTKIVENEHFGYPVEWFPSVSATIGDRFPERSVFQLFIALTSGPRFLLVWLNYILMTRGGKEGSGAAWVAAVGVFRTFTCGGWTYVTSTDDHDAHDVFMISYLVATIPWTVGCLMLCPPDARTVRLRKYLAGGFFGTLVPLIYFFIQHKVHRVPGAYTIYAFFEWALVLLDVGFDAVTAIDFQAFEIVVREVGGKGSGEKRSDTLLQTQKDKPIISDLSTSVQYPELLDALADVYMSFIFWTNQTALGLVVWYFDLWVMGLSGMEGAILASLSPFLLEIRPFRNHIVSAMPGSYLLQGLCGLGAYLVQRVDLRLGVLSIGVWTGTLGLVASFWRDRADAGKLEARVTAWLLGLILSSLAKFSNATNNPVWPILHSGNGGWNKTGLAIFGLAIARMYMRKSAMAATPSTQHSEAKPKGLSGLAGLGFGALCFIFHSLLSDSSTMIAWSWTGYPISGPMPVPHGMMTFAAMGLGVLSGLYVPGIYRTWSAFGVASVAAMVLTYSENWTGFYGGLVLTIYSMGATPVLVGNMLRFSVGRTFGIAFCGYNFLVLFHCWCVGYAFVPGGQYVRERTDWVMMSTLFMLGCGVWSVIQNGDGGKVGVVGQGGKGSTYYPARSPAVKRVRAAHVWLLLGLQLLGVGIAYVRFPAYDYPSYHPESKLITAGIWTIHFHIDNDAWSSERRMEALMRETELDLVGLLESDNQRIIMGNRDLTQYFSESLGMWVDHGPGPDKNTWGCALLSKFPIVNSTHHLLPSPAGELAPAIQATVEAYGELVDVYVFHSGQEEDVEDRRLQTEYMSNLMGQSTRPAILLSYLVTKPGEGNYNKYVSENSGMRDIDPSDWDRWCEYILYKGMKRTGYARVSRSTITDTELQIGKFVIGEPERLDGERISEDQVPVDMRFPALFRGEGVRGHRYHVFDEPRYFA